MFKKEQNYIGLQLSETSLQMMHLHLSSSGIKVIDVIKRDTREVDEEDIPKILETALTELNIKRPQGFCVIPSTVVTTKNIEIPSLDPEEIRSIIDLQAGRHTPYSREEILVGYITIGVFQRNYTKVLLTIVNREVIKKQIDMFERAGIRIDKVLFAPEGIARFYASALQVKDEDVPVGIINIANQTTDL